MFFDELRQDLYVGVRTLLRKPGFAAFTVLTLALGIAASTAVFSVFSAVVLRPLPFPDPDRLVLLVNTFQDADVFPALSPHRVNVWRERTTGFVDAAAYTGSSMTLRGGDAPEQVLSGRVSANFFRLFSARIARGRAFTEEEDRPGGARVALLSDGLWQRQFGRAPDVLGQTISLNRERYVVIGVLAPDFDPTLTKPIGRRAAPDLWIPLQLDPNSENDAHFLFGAARLPPGATLEAAQAETQRVVPAFRQRFPGVMRPGAGLTVMPISDLVVGDMRSSLLLFVAAVTGLLLIACINAACLLLVRAASRQHEWAIRAASGASRSRLARHALTDSLILAVCAVALGVPLGFAGIRLLLTLQPGNLPQIAQDGSYVAMDWRTLVFAVAMSLVCGAVCGSLPAWRAARANLETLLRSGSRNLSGRGHNRSGTFLVVGEVALTVVLLVGAALLIRSFAELRRVDPGFDARRVITMQMPMTDRDFRTTLPMMQVLDEGRQALTTLPGVEAVGATLISPPLAGSAFLRIDVVGRPDDTLLGGWQAVTPEYFDVFNIPLLRGRHFTAQDSDRSPAVVVINQALARRFWPDEDALSSQVLLGDRAGPEFEDVPRSIIGIVGNVRQEGLDRDARPTAYVPLAQVPDGEVAFFTRAGAHLTWVVRTTGPPYAVADAIRERLRVSSGLPVTRIRSMEDVSSASTARQQFEMTLITVFGVAALLLAALGVYGVAAYAVRQRTRELGIRLALGATARQVRRAILIQGLKPTALGIALGTASAFGLARTLASFLFGVSPHDGVVFLAVPCALAAVALAATWLPADRATRIDPAQLVREE